MTGILASDLDVVRRAYAALAAGDMYELEGVSHGTRSGMSRVATSTPETWWVGQRSEMSSSCSWGRCRGGTLRTELVDIAVGEKYVVAVHRATGQHNGATLDSTSCEVVLVVRGRVQEVWATHANQAEVDAFWT